MPLGAPNDASRSGTKAKVALPVRLAAEACQRGAVYWHLSLDLPPEARGRGLSADEMDYFGARPDDGFAERRDRAGDVTKDKVITP